MKLRGHHRIMLVCSAAGSCVAFYLLLENYLNFTDPICAASTWFACGSSEALLGVPWLKTFNSILGALAFLALCVIAIHLKNLPQTAIRPRQCLSWICNISLVYIFLLRALEFFVSGGVCPWCMAMSMCFLGATTCSWVEYAKSLQENDETFLSGDFYFSNIKFAVVMALVCFTGICSTRGALPDIKLLTSENLIQAGFSLNENEVKQKARELNSPFLLLIYNRRCPHCYLLSINIKHASLKQILNPLPKASLEASNPAASRIMHNLNGARFPMLIVYGSDEIRRGVIFGNRSPSQLKKELQEILNARPNKNINNTQKKEFHTNP